MAYLPVSAFQRPLTHAQLEQAHLVDRQSEKLPDLDKWALLRALVKAQGQFGLGDRDLALLQSLLSFHPHDALRMGRDMIIFPSNRSICERMNGMPDSTMRRHLRKLIAAGLLLRRDSHNGKRFAFHSQGERLAFGLDLTPLMLRAPEIFEAAAARDEADENARRLRIEIQLMRRDIFALIPLLPEEDAERASDFWHATTKVMRRKLTEALLEQLHLSHRETLAHLKAAVLDSSDVQNEQQIHNSNIKIFESKEDETHIDVAGKDDVTLNNVLEACPEIQTYSDEPITDWSRLFDTTAGIHKFLGITEAVHKKAQRTMGPERTAVVIAAILQMFDRIRAPGAYLNALITKADRGMFSCKPMIMALLSRSSNLTAVKS